MAGETHAIGARTGLPQPAGTGLLAVQHIRRMIECGEICPAMPLGEGQLQPASLDLRLGPTAHRVRASALPSRGRSVAALMADLTLHTFDLVHGAVLETGCVYVVPLVEALALPAGVSAATNPKSSTGRIDVLTRIIADGVAAFDRIPSGYRGALYAEICPQTFPILVRTGSSLSQIRFRIGEPADSDGQLADLHARERLVSDPAADIDRGIALSVDMLGTADGLVGYRAKRHSGLIDVDRPASCRIADFWDPLTALTDRRLILDPDQFYILASKEAVHVPPSHAAEMVPFDPLVGEFRVHYAGFMDPGFGHAPAGGAGARVVLEVRSHKVPFILEDGQIVGRLVYERMLDVPEVLYGRELGSNYQAQGLKLSKHFY